MAADTTPDPSVLLGEYAARLQRIYDERTAGNHTFTGVLYEFAAAAVPLLSSRDDETTALRTELEQHRTGESYEIGEQGTKHRDEIAKLRAKLDTAYQLIGEEALIDMEPPIPPYGTPEREALRASLRGEQG